MAAPAAPADITKLEGVRTRLRNLSAALQTLTININSANPLMPWPYFYDAFNHITRELALLTDYLDTHRAFLDSAHIYPLPSFPGVEHEALLAQLLRKKLDAQAEGWLKDVERVPEKLDAEDQVDGSGNLLSADERRQLLKTASATAEKVLGEIPKGLDYTLSELINGIDSVETGLRRELRTGDERVVQDDENDVEDMPAMPLEDVMRFMTRGELPKEGGMSLL